MKHLGECLVGTNSFYGCGKGGHIVKECRNLTIQGKGNDQDQPSGPSYEAQKRICFYALKAIGEQENSPNIVTVCYKSFLLIFMLA